MKKLQHRWLVLLLLVTPTADAELRGYVKSFAVVQDGISNTVFEQPSTWQSQNSVRLMWSRFGERTAFQVHYELNPVFRSQPSTGIDQGTLKIVDDGYRLTDLESSLSESDSKTQFYQNLDRFNVQWRFDHGDLTLGRQAITFGAARIINPTDVFLPFNVQTFNTEYRNGVDALRYQRPWGDLGEIDVGIILGDDARRDSSAAFLQLRGNRRGVDLQFAMIEFAGQSLIGGGLQTALGDFGFWLEAAHVSADETYLRVSTGLDYAFTEHTFGQVEYHYNGAGTDQPTDYLARLQTGAYRDGGVFLLGEHYLIPSLAVQMSPLWNIAVQGILNLSDESLFASISGEYSVSDNLYMDVGIYYFNGHDPELTPAGLPGAGSEYGANPGVAYLSLRYYF